MNGTVRQSPVEAAMEHLHPRWEELHGMRIAMDFGNPQAERERLNTLALADLSALPRMGVKGAGASAWLESQGISVPGEIYQHQFIEGGGLIVRTGTAEFFLEDSVRSSHVARLMKEPPAASPQTYPFHRQDASFLLAGERIHDVLLQTCGYNFRRPDASFIFTRFVGVSCSVLLSSGSHPLQVRLWCDPSFGMYLWEQLFEIVQEAGGSAVGAAAVFGDLSSS